MDENFSKNVADANVTHPATGVYCVTGLAFSPKSIDATLDHASSLSSSPDPAVFVNLSSPLLLGCVGAQAGLIIVNGNSDAINHGLYITVN